MVAHASNPSTQAEPGGWQSRLAWAIQIHQRPGPGLKTKAKGKGQERREGSETATFNWKVKGLVLFFNYRIGTIPSMISIIDLFFGTTTTYLRTLF